MTTPMYREIAEQLLQRIESGEFPSGLQMPTEQDLQAQFNASRSTIREAIKQLTTLGLVETKPGQGTFVVPKVPPFVNSLTGSPETAVDYTSGVLEGRAARRRAARSGGRDPGGLAEVAAGLGLEPGTEGRRRAPQRALSIARPGAWRHCSLQGEVPDHQSPSQPSRPAASSKGTVTCLRNTIGIRQVGYRDWVTVRAPNATEADF